MDKRKPAFSIHDDEGVVVLCKALRIYERNMEKGIETSGGLLDIGFDTLHHRSASDALKHLQDSDVNSSTNDARLLVDTIKIRKQKFRLDNISIKKAGRRPANDTNQRAEVMVPHKQASVVSVKHSTSDSGKKLHSIAKELLTTEVVYVEILHLLDQIFHKAVRARDVIPKADVDKIFGHVSAIYQFHSTFLLPQLKERLENWDIKPRIGDILMQAAPFLKMHSQYMRHFEDSSSVLEAWLEKSSEFTEIIKTIEGLPTCKSLSLQHHMLAPVQRIPRYKLLLEDYVKRLPGGATDKKDAETALALVADAAKHSNEDISDKEKHLKLAKKLPNFTNADFDIAAVARKLLKEGPMKKIDDFEDKQQDSYLFLFSDVVVDCVPPQILQRNSYKVRTKIDLDGVHVYKVETSDDSFGFCVHGMKQYIEFGTRTSDEQNEWIREVEEAVQECERKKNSFKTTSSTTDSRSLSPSASSSFTLQDKELGKRCPRWLKYSKVSSCMVCSKHFVKLIRTKNHCRACGKIICADCSNQQVLLEYVPDEPQKICDVCYSILAIRKKGSFCVDANALSQNSLLADFLYFAENCDGKKMTKMWCVVPNGRPRLFLFKEPKDIRWEKMIELTKSSVSTCTESRGYSYCFKLEVKQTTYFLAMGDKEIAQKWLFVLKESGRGRILKKEDLENEECAALTLPPPSPKRKTNIFQNIVDFANTI
ncbi:FYVE, RhoGEF and PH domain-containing protein 2-like [Clavelina lepadiformis]|uniref:FYVE, RhoGEF and PH domain-containing protein 2-like n=1 Tax=Clavelina lepadiformis TaxID=159417 RepID=UPI0040421FBE